MNPKAESATVLFQLIIALLGFFVLFVPVLLFAAEGVSCLIPML